MWPTDTPRRRRGRYVGSLEGIGPKHFRIRNLSMNGQEAVLFPVSLSLSISPQEVDAGAELTLKAVAECPEDYDLSGDQISFHDAAGREIGRGPRAAPPDGGSG